MADEQHQRAKMFTAREIEIIMDFMEHNLQTIKASHSQNGPGAAQKVAKLWEALTKEVNGCGHGPRTVKQIKEKWRNLVKTAKGNVAEQKRSAMKTGGGPPCPEMSQTSLCVASLFEGSASFHGICDDADTVVVSDPSRFITGGESDELRQQHPMGLLPCDFSTDIDTGAHGLVPVAADSPSTTHDVVVPKQPSYPEKSATDVEYVQHLTGPATEKYPHKTNQQNEISQRKRTLKDLQMAYYESQIKLAESQQECYVKFAKLADVLITKFQE